MNSCVISEFDFPMKKGYVIGAGEETSRRQPNMFSTYYIIVQDIVNNYPGKWLLRIKMPKKKWSNRFSANNQSLDRMHEGHS